MSAPKSLRGPSALVGEGLIDPSRLADLERVAARYAVAITAESAALIDPSNPQDPVGLQFLPHESELVAAPGEMEDPIGDAAHSPVEGIVHRYPDRALLMLTHTCASYCRFCFRRETVGPHGDGTLSPQALSEALNYIAERSEIWEVILTGGDPLILSPRRLEEVMAALSAISHVKVVRIHTRVPAVDPDRITAALVQALQRSKKAVFVALHVNHPRELTANAVAACARLIDAGVPMISQSVLLKGVNDDPQTLAMLMRSFVEARIKPYYLHQGDLAPGTAHFRTTLAEGQSLMREIRGTISGLCQPTFILDIPGGHGKAPVGPSYFSADDRHQWVEDPSGARHLYPPVD